MPRCSGEVVSLGELRERIYRYIVDGEGVGGPEMTLGMPHWPGPGFRQIKYDAVELIRLIGVAPSEHVTLHSIFHPPVYGKALLRAGLLAMAVNGMMFAAGLDETLAHGSSPATVAWSADARVLYE